MLHMRLRAPSKTHVRDKGTARHSSSALHVITVPTARFAATKIVRPVNVVSTPKFRAIIAPHDAWASLQYQCEAGTTSSRLQRPQEETAKRSLIPPTPPLKVAIVQRTIRINGLTLVLIPTDKTSITLPRNRGTMQTSCQIYLVLLTLPASPTLKQMPLTLLNHNWPQINCKLPFPVPTR